jgi:septation ring formation regulator EzrA
MLSSNDALVLVMTIPFAALAVFAKYHYQYEAQKKKVPTVHPIAQIWRQMQGLDLPNDSESDVETLRKEVADLKKQLYTLRDTATQYDLSIDHHLRELDQRVDDVESEVRRPTRAYASSEAPNQTIRPNS